jgi:lipopolysaccharide transport system ATP-binding protein
MSTVIQVDRVFKEYRLGQISGKRLADDVSRWWARLRGKEDPLSKIDVVSVKSNGNGHKRIPPPFAKASPRLKSKDHIWALKELSFDVKEGEVLGVIGKNGAGKSTLLKILSRVTAPSSGEVRVKGRIASLLEVGTGFHPELTGRENIFLNGAILGMTKAEIKKKFDEIVAFSEVEKFIDTPVKRYSSGMYVRLAFGVAAHLDPDILIVDEVLAVGDAAFQKKCLGKMGEVSREGRTILFVSHNMTAVAALCQRAIVLSQGSMIFDGPTDEAISLYTRKSQAVSEARVDLASRTVERYGSRQYASLHSLELLNADGLPSTTLQMGRKAVFRLAINIIKPRDDFEIGIVVHNLNSVTQHILCSCWEGLNSIREVGLNLVEVELPAIHLFPGEYEIRVWISIRGQYYDDAVHEVLRFSVVEGRVNSHRTYFAQWSRNTEVYTPSLWRASKLDSLADPLIVAHEN